MNASAHPRLHLIRHGETEWALNGRHTGVTDIPLTERGEQEARELRPWLSRIAFAQVLSSPRQRARRTQELSGVAGPAEIVEDLAEWDYGEYEGRTGVSIRAERPGWDNFLDGCPGGESPAEVGARADRLIARLRGLSGNIALFSHGEFSRVLACRWIDAPVSVGRHLTLGTATLSILSYPANHPNTPAIELWNAAPRVLLG